VIENTPGKANEVFPGTKLVFVSEADVDPKNLINRLPQRPLLERHDAQQTILPPRETPPVADAIENGWGQKIQNTPDKAGENVIPHSPERPRLPKRHDAQQTILPPRETPPVAIENGWGQKIQNDALDYLWEENDGRFGEVREDNMFAEN
jgi:hypothetical protein